MANKDLVVKMTIDSKEFDGNLKNAKANMKGFEREAKQTGASFSNTMQTMGKAIAVVAAASGAFKTFEKAIRSTEQGIDALDRATYTAKTSIKGFFQSISNGTLSGFVKDLNGVVTAAREAYNAIDALGTMKMWSSARINQLNAQISEQRVISMSKRSTQAEKDEANRMISLYVGQLEALTSGLLGTAQKASTAKLRQIAGVSSDYVSDKDLESFLYLWEHGELQGAADQYFNTHAKSTIRKGWTMGGGGMGRMPQSYSYPDTEWSAEDAKERYRAMQNILTVDEAVLQEYYNLLNEESIQRQSLAAAKLKANRAIENGMTTGGGGGGSTAIHGTAELIPQLPVMDEYSKKIAEVGERLNRMNEVSEETRLIGMVQASLYEQQITELNSYATALGSLGNAFSQLAGIASDGSPWQTFMGILGAVASQVGGLISTYASLVAVESVAKAIESGEGIPFPYNLVAMAAAASAIIGLIATVSSQAKSAGNFANGGIVGGNSYSGDHLIAHVNSGEMILNRQQQASLFGGGNVHFVIEGSQLQGCLDNYHKTLNL